MPALRNTPQKYRGFISVLPARLAMHSCPAVSASGLRKNKILISTFFGHFLVVFSSVCLHVGRVLTALIMRFVAFLSLGSWLRFVIGSI